MSEKNDLRELALTYHRQLPHRIWQYLNKRGIPDQLIHSHVLGWNGSRITIPIFGRDGHFAFFRLARDPQEKSPAPKMLTSAGSPAELYGWEAVLAKASQIIICEGEFDRLVLEGRGLAAVTSTGGAGTFRREWAEALREIPNVFVCFDNDAAGRAGAIRVAQLISQARIVSLPDDVGEGGDVTDFLVRLGHDREEFVRVLERAQPLPPETRAGPHNPPRNGGKHNEVQHLKSLVAIEELIARYVEVRPSGRNYTARCPFHEDHTPSFVVFPQTKSFHCFGCRVHGDVLSFLMRVESLSFPEALFVLRELAEQHE